MVSRQNIKRYCDAIAAAFKPERIILFGSHARGQPGEDSDVDVLVVMRNARRLGRHPAAAIRMKVRSDFPVDMLVRDEREVARRVKQRDLFMLEITERGRVSPSVLRPDVVIQAGVPAMCYVAPRRKAAGVLE